jgi:amino acid transporter
MTKPVNAALGIARGRRLTLLELTCLACFAACDGACGIESLTGAVGLGWALVLILLIPWFCSAPIALVAAELSPMMPEEHGYYMWVQESLGPFWAVQEARWTLGCCGMLLASFPVLFVAYLSSLIPARADSADVPRSASRARCSPRWAKDPGAPARGGRPQIAWRARPCVAR